jgi:hypothetical protein
VVLIHGGIVWVIQYMVSFSDFLVGMGYPAQSITNPGDGTYTFSCYESSRVIAGSLAWYYEKEGLRPLMVGHSQGGIQAVKTLHNLAPQSGRQIEVWNPVTWKTEKRLEITDPLTGQPQSVVGLRLPFVCSLGGGGLTRILPNQWDMMGRLRAIPDSVEEFTCFYNRNDVLGGDLLGYSSLNLSQASGTAVVLLATPEMKDWINNFDPTQSNENEPKFEVPSHNILWAADVWYSIKKHWVLELQRAIQARRTHQNGN